MSAYLRTIADPKKMTLEIEAIKEKGVRVLCPLAATSDAVRQCIHLNRNTGLRGRISSSRTCTARSVRLGRVALACVPFVYPR